jgi:radical SAM superfamily enzyme YgiQ (UPF0313 family)
MNAPRVTLVSALGGYSRGPSPDEVAVYAPPLGILTLAARIRNSYPVQAIDLDELWRSSVFRRSVFQAASLDAICATKPDLIGFSTVSGCYPLTIRLAEECSVLLPNATIIFGGPQATVTDVDTMSAFPFVDFVLRGEADDTFPALLRAFAVGSQVNQIPGLTFRDSGRIRRNPAAAAILDLDKTPLPAYDLIPCTRELDALALEIGRGCPYACTFCSTNDFFRRRFRLKSPEKVLDEMNRLHEAMGVKIFDLVHDMFTVDRKRVVAFCETMIGAGSPYKWSCSARTDSVDSELLQLMKQAGCHDIFFGIETGSKRMQRVIDKDLDLGVARQVLRECSDLGIHATASLIIGYPQETREDLRDTVEFFASVLVMPWVDPQFNVLSPLAGTPITNEYRNQLALDENWGDISENATLQDAVDRLMIAAHPDIFPNFYAFPYHTSRELLKRVQDFVFYGVARCGSLMCAVWLRTNDMFGVFELWNASHPDWAPEWYETGAFVDELLLFCETNYGHDRTVAATARFCRSTFETAKRRRRPVAGDEPSLTLRDKVMIIDCDCDINALLESMTQGKQPDEPVYTTPVTVVVRLTTLNRAAIMRFPALTMELLRHAEQGSALSAIERDFEARGISLPGLPPQKVVHGGIKYLEEQNLVYRVLPEEANLRLMPQSGTRAKEVLSS